jgi:hypothetical protein
LFKPHLHQGFYLIGFGLCRCCGFLRFRFGVALNQSRIFTQPPAMSRNALVMAEKYSNSVSNNVISFSLPELFSLPDGGQLVVCFLYRSQQRFYPENSLAVRQLAGGSGGTTGFVSSGGSGVHCPGT